MQHLWSPFFLENALEKNGKTNSFFYSPGERRWRLAILEPNICSVKTCHLPMLLCDAAYRRDRQFVEYLRVYNAMKLKEHQGFIGFARSLDLVNHGLATFEPRLPIFDILSGQADAVVSHHWHNGQNYLYYETLYGGYALIHNSTFLDDCGYRYDDYDCEDGALALLQAHREHDRSARHIPGEGAPVSGETRSLQRNQCRRLQRGAARTGRRWSAIMRYAAPAGHAQEHAGWFQPRGARLPISAPK